MNKFNYDLASYGYWEGKIEPVPKNDYYMILNKIEQKTSTKTQSSYHKFTFSITRGMHVGKQVSINLSLDNPDPNKHGFARAVLRTISSSMNKEQQLNTVKDLNVLIKGVLVGYVDIREYQGSLFNEIKMFKTIDEFNGTNEEEAQSSLLTMGILAKPPQLTDDQMPF